MAITNDFCAYADATGAIKYLPVVVGLPCSNRKNPDQLTQIDINSMVADLPPAPPGFKWERALCQIADGPWVIDPDQNPPGFTPDAGQIPPSSAIGDRSNEELVGYSTSNTSVL